MPRSEQRVFYLRPPVKTSTCAGRWNPKKIRGGTFRQYYSREHWDLLELLPEALWFSQFGLAVGSLELTFDQEVFITAIQFKPTIELLEEDLTEPLSGTL